MTAAQTWSAWLATHAIPYDPSLGTPPAVLQQWVNAHVAALGKAVPDDIRALAFRATADLGSLQITTDTSPADRAWAAWLAASAVAKTKDSGAIEAVQHFLSWLPRASSAAQNQLIQWSDAFAHVARTVQDTSANGFDKLAELLKKLYHIPIDPPLDLLTTLLWGFFGLATLLLGVGGLVLLSGGGQGWLLAIGAGQGSAIASFGAGTGGGIMLFAGSAPILARGVTAAIPSALRLLPGMV